MSDKKVICSVDGIVGSQIFKGRKVYAMCGKIKCASDECSLPIGECEHQKTKNESAPT